MATYANISIDQGSSFSSVVSVQGPNGLDYDLAGYTVRGQIRKSYASTNYVAFACGVQPGVDGKIQLQLTATQTSGMKAGRYVFDVEIVEISTGAVTRVVEGQVEINPRVTRV